MRFAPAHPATHVALAFVRNDGTHVGWLADDATGGTNATVCQICEQIAHAEESGLLVVGQRQMQRQPFLCCQKLGNRRQCNRYEAFHVSGAAAVNATIAVVGNKRIA